MLFDLEQLNQQQTYKLLASTIVPRPIAWVVSQSREGAINAAPYSLFNFFSGHPPVVCVGMGIRSDGPKDSLANIRETGEFVINLVNCDLVDAMNTTATPFARGVDELQKAGLDTVASSKVNVPRIANSPVGLECRLRQVIDVDATGVIVIATVIAMHIADAAVINAERHHIDASRLDLIGRMESPGWYTGTRQRFERQQMTVAQWESVRQNQIQQEQIQQEQMQQEPPLQAQARRDGQG